MTLATASVGLGPRRSITVPVMGPRSTPGSAKATPNSDTSPAEASYSYGGVAPDGDDRRPGSDGAERLGTEERRDPRRERRPRLRCGLVAHPATVPRSPSTECQGFANPTVTIEKAASTCLPRSSAARAATRGGSSKPSVNGVEDRAEAIAGAGLPWRPPRQLEEPRGRLELRHARAACGRERAAVSNSASADATSGDGRRRRRSPCAIAMSAVTGSLSSTDVAALH